jgi:NAD dependent epimerase/dehydratase family enzyme
VEAADVLLGGNRVSAQKIMDRGFKFKYPSLKPALQDLLKNNK